ncbi:hypothetical protein [uncultured Tessaracoccus sp.]|uniref:hypothetical protein n=1 Tax=uncultured Tessaracoccus sp. TaxID=905023 RepID=UPI00261FA09B|nr:hypothetical protein [uncultured Tessaracoccus sp.]
MFARVRKAALACVAASAIALTGCTASGWQPNVPPAAGVQGELAVTQGNGAAASEKARNVLFVVDDEGKGLLAGTVASVDGTQVQAIHYAPEKPDGSFGEPSTLDFQATVPADGTARFEEKPVTVKNADLTPGRNARVVIELSTGSIPLEVPVYSNTHPDFEKLWETTQS